ncbi:hypothetical protein BD770DRAFT_386738 [Pilaira anomala]|nr:hypothetical protein BD770DRAFT_386738 [Pilaira anomala]
MKLFSLEKLQKKVKQQQVSCEKMSNVTKEEENNTSVTTTAWISSIYRKFCYGNQKKQDKEEGPRDNNDDDNNNNEKGTLHHVTDSGVSSPKHEKTSSPVNSNVTSSSTPKLQKEIVSLSPFLKEKTTVTAVDHQYRHLTQPFKPLYEVEWQKDQWLPLNRCANQQIEKLRKKGFSKALIRKDPMLMKRDKQEPNILLELSFLQQQQQQENDQQITSFSVRRVRWWHRSEVGCAHLPDNDYSVELSSFPSQHHGLLKPLHYSKPPYFMQQHTSLSA